MSVNQSRADKNEPPQFRKFGRSGNAGLQRNYSGGGGKGGGGGNTTAPPSSSNNNNRSSKKAVNYAQGAQPRVNSPNTNSDFLNSTPGGTGVPNGAHLQPPSRGASGAPLTGTAIKPSDVSSQKSATGPPRAPQGNAVVPGSETTGPSTPTKGSADASRAFTLQFGSISPGLMNGMQIPPRTSSAPPNLDEQKQAQARLEAIKTTKVPSLPVPKQPLPKKDNVAVDQTNPNESHSTPKTKKDSQPPLVSPPPTQSQKVPVSVQMSVYHHSPLHAQYNSPNPQMQSPNSSLSIPLPILPPQVQQPVYIQHHHMPPQGIIHTGPPFPSAQIPPHLLGPHYSSQQMAANRKSVKITDPKTHEELNLGGFGDAGPKGSGPRPPHGLQQSQPTPSFPQINYFPNSYNSGHVFHQPPLSSPLTSQQIPPASQLPPRTYNQVTVKPAANAQEKVSDSSLVAGGTATIEKNELPKTPRAHVENKSSNATFGSFQSENSTNSSSSVPVVEDSDPVVNSEVEVTKGATVKEEQMKQGKKVQSISVDQVTETVESSTPDDVLETSKKVAITSITTIQTGIEINSDKIEEPKADSSVGPEEQGDVMMTNGSEQHDIDTKIDKPLTSADIETCSSSDASLNKAADEDLVNKESGQHTVSVPDVPPPCLNGEDRASLISPTLSDASKAKGGNTGKQRKKRKDILKNADAQGTTSDLYNAYKGPEEKKESLSIETTVETIIPQKTAEKEKDVPNKLEPDDWEDAADISTPKLETSVNGESVDGMAKKYSRDFLLKFAEQFTELPQGFEHSPDTAEVISNVNNVSRGDRPSRYPSNVGHDNRWNNKQQGGQGMRIDVSYGGGNAGFRPGSKKTTGGGIMQSPGPHMQRNNSDSDRWQRMGGGNQKGLIPSPQTPMQVMHKAERKYEVGKVTDEEQAKQRQLKGILNKLTPQNFEKLFEQVKQVNIDNTGTLSGVINQIFDKALMEPTFCEMYSNFCSRLSAELPDFNENNEKVTFKRLLLNKCQEEFEREEEEANRSQEEGEVKQTEEEREEKRIKARRRMLGNIRLIGELYKKKMLTERIMHECIKKLLGQYQNPDEEDIEALCKLMSTIGVMIDHSKAKEHMDVYFDTMFRLSNNMKLSSRVRFMLKDAIDLRKNKWQQRRKVEGPKKIDEVHRDAAQERHAQSSRMARGPSFNLSTRSRQPMEFAPRSNPPLPSPNSQSFRQPQQSRGGFVNQESRYESFENRALRPSGDNPVALMPQGGLFKTAPNGLREDSAPRQVNTPSDGFDRNPRCVQTPSPVADNKVWPEERLRDMSLKAIKEFYSARDEKEVATCIKELNAPSFYPSMISIWLSDSFERKDVDRDLLAKLFVNLTKSIGILTQDSLIKGLESVLAILEDSVNDAPKAGEYLGRIVGKLLLENVIPYKQVWQLIYEGGEEAGRLVEIGLAADVVGVILEMITSEKGDGFLNEIRQGSNLRVEEFRPPNSKRGSRLDKFV